MHDSQAPKLFLSAMRLFVLLAFLLGGFVYAKATNGADYEIQSPDGALSLRLQNKASWQWSVLYRGKSVIAPSTIDLKTNDGQSLFAHASALSAKTLKIDRTINVPIPQKASVIQERYHGLLVTLDNGFQIELRAYNDGVAYRIIGLGEGQIVIENEVMELNFPKGTRSLFPEEESIISHNERLYIDTLLADIKKPQFASLPIYFAVDDVNVVFTEADLFDYPAMYLYATGQNHVTAKFPGVVTRATPQPGSEDRNEILEMADHIAVTQKNRTFPWRAAVISDRDGDLPASHLVYLLARESKIADTGWIKPGKVAWDWYNANNLYGVDFKAGINTQTYKHYIDFAAKFNLEYIILDEGWSLTTTTMDASNPEIDIHDLVTYGKKKGVNIILWSLWKPLDKDYKKLLKLYAEWGIAGVKIDFMQRSDQYMVAYYEKIAAEAAKNKLLVDYHGAFKPTGLSRTWPNVLSYEGVKGNENNKWSQDVTPEHNVTIPFVRMVAGPMDYTPGAMVNTLAGNHRVSHFRPMAMGTRAHQVAMYAVYESPLQMLCDSPSNYSREPKITKFIGQFPSVWDETRVLAGKVGDFILVARRAGETWYLGAMTDGSAREMEVDFSFLGKGKYNIDIIEDGVNAERHAEDYVMKQAKVSNKTTLPIRLSSGGGWAAIVSK